LYGYNHTPNKLKEDDDLSFRMNIGGLSRAQWRLIIAAIRHWQANCADQSDTSQARAVEQAARSMQGLIDNGSNGYSIQYSDKFITRKPTRAEMKEIREMERTDKEQQQEVGASAAKTKRSRSRA
jgi:hypothetical protein